MSLNCLPGCMRMDASVVLTSWPDLTLSIPRLKRVLPTVIHPDQVAYLKGRYIGQNIRTIIYIMHYTKEEDQEGLIWTLRRHSIA